ncbi:GGDEF domain-containing protein [Curvibacter sp. CHRR-16]|uniref:GGDEF domain-containing protein n=1 Tax=Curvibacter sp. CHRR-16 TaxID=2835872 RepID=UPI001BDA7CBE|nr:GGDEF domain-containing protein [Curvibacter sp. CHRR-16]MBT0568912.1 GGDEF domain-containing protein [Curvibacter sp. CHRR-16]
MNALMAALGVQLLIYALAWWIVGWKFRIHTQACYSWSVGWLLSACAAVALYFMPSMVLVPQRFVVNLFTYAAFVCLYRGLLFYTQRKFNWLVILWMLVPLFMAELVRIESPQLYGVIAFLFALGATMPMVGAMQLLTVPVMGLAGRRQRRTSNLLLIVPIFFLLMLFWWRAALLLFYDNGLSIHFGDGSPWDLSVTLGMLLLLGMFNLLLFNLVVGALLRKLQELSFTDQLTGLFNRRVLMERLQEEHERSKRSRKPYSVVTFDLDDFKRINDTHGHLVGDEVLAAVAKRLASSIRATDILARTGGEEFMLVLPLADLAGAEIQAERLRAGLQAEPFQSHAGVLRMTASFGVACICADDTDTDQLLQRADAALYAAKAAGRNCVRLAS